MTNLRTIAEDSYERMPYGEAIAALRRSGRAFQFPVDYGVDLQTEHERYLTEEYCRQARHGVTTTPGKLSPSTCG